MKRLRLARRFEDSRVNDDLVYRGKTDIFRQKIPLTSNNRITYIYKRGGTGKILEVVCVSLEIFLKKRWRTIVYYDSSHHGEMHRHLRISLDDTSDTPTKLGVRQRGTQRRLLRWAIKDLLSNYVNYKFKFLKRCGYSKKEIYEILT